MLSMAPALPLPCLALANRTALTKFCVTSFYFYHSRLPDQLPLPNDINFHDTAASFEHQEH